MNSVRGTNLIAFPNKIKRANSRIPRKRLGTGQLCEISSPQVWTKSPQAWTGGPIESTTTSPKGEWNGVTIDGQKVYVTHYPENEGKPGYLTEFWRIG